METLHEAYGMAKKNDGGPGIDGVTFDAIEEGGVESFLPVTGIPTATFTT
jgi:RNA-directed DNA polymerase